MEVYSIICHLENGFLIIYFPPVSSCHNRIQRGKMTLHLKLNRSAIVLCYYPDGLTYVGRYQSAMSHQSAT